MTNMEDQTIITHLALNGGVHLLVHDNKLVGDKPLNCTLEGNSLWVDSSPNGFTTFFLPKQTILEVKNIKKSGSGKVTLMDGCIDPVSLEIDMKGSGSLTFDRGTKISFAKVKLSGSGGIEGSNTIVKNVGLQISGSGNICGFYATKMIHASLSGSGGISATASRECSVMKNASGSGSITIHCF